MENKKYLSELYSVYLDRMQSELQTKEIIDSRSQIISMTDELNKVLSIEQQEMLQNLLELENHHGSLEDKQVFMYAFSLAIRLVCDGLINSDESEGELCKIV